MEYSRVQRRWVHTRIALILRFTVLLNNSLHQPLSKDLAEGQVALKSVHGKYLEAQPDGRAEWNRDRADVWEYFNLEKRQGGKIALKGAHGKYVSAQPDGSVQINRAAAPQGGWEEFTIEHGSIQPVGREGYDVVRLKSIHGKYLSAPIRWARRMESCTCARWWLGRHRDGVSQKGHSRHRIHQEDTVGTKEV